MDELERALRDLLTDERLDLPVPAGATAAVHTAVRRRRQRRMLVASTSAVAVIALGVGSAVAITGVGDKDVVVPGGRQPPPTTAPLTSPAASSPTPSPAVSSDTDEIDWTALPYDPAHPVVIPGTQPDPHVPWCTADQLSFTGGFQGSGGMSLGFFTARNTGAACGVQGIPTVTGLAADGTPIALPAPADEFVVHPWVEVGRNQHATLPVGLGGIGSRCVGAVDRLRVDLGHGGGSAVVAAINEGTRTRGVVPAHCGEGTAETYRVNVTAWTSSTGEPALPWRASDLNVIGLPKAVMQGTILRYRVVLRSRTADLNTCLPFRQTLASATGSATVVATATNMLPCRTMLGTGSNAWTLDMEIPVPSAAPTGATTVTWETPIPDLALTTGTVDVVAAPPYCRQDQLGVSAGKAGAGAGSYYDTIVFTNTSAAACSLRGYPGVEFVDESGRPLPTHPQRDDLQPVETVALSARGGTASFLVSGSDFAPPAGAAPCPRTGGLLVIAPNLRTQVRVQAGADCDKGSIRVYPVVAGTRPNP